MKNDYDDVEELVNRYKAGDSEAGYQLIQAYKPFLRKYQNILAGRVDTRDRYQRVFMSLFMSDRDARADIRRKPYRKSSLIQAYKEFAMVVSLLKQYPSEDLWQDMQCELLTLAKRYEKQPDKQFSNYVEAAFPYCLARLIKKLTRSATSFLNENTRQYNDQVIRSPLVGLGGAHMMDGIDVPSELDELNDETDLGPTWMSGETCNDAFATLVPSERLILRLKYYDGLTDKEIAKRLGQTAAYVGQQRRAAIEKLRRFMEGGAAEPDAQSPTRRADA